VTGQQRRHENETDRKNLIHGIGSTATKNWLRP
jgi:hypothetical protein